MSTWDTGGFLHGMFVGATGDTSRARELIMLLEEAMDADSLLAENPEYSQSPISE